MQDQEIFFPDRRRGWKLVAFSAAIAAAGMWFQSVGSPRGLLLLTLGVGGVTVFGLPLLPGSAHLKLDPQGFKLRVLYRSHLFRWPDIDRFEVKQVGRTKLVVFKYAPAYRGRRLRRMLSSGLSGWDGALPETYGMSAEDLEVKMSSWKERFGGG
jgi:hypothetical protein